MTLLHKVIRLVNSFVTSIRYKIHFRKAFLNGRFGKSFKTSVSYRQNFLTYFLITPRVTFQPFSSYTDDMRIRPHIFCRAVSFVVSYRCTNFVRAFLGMQSGRCLDIFRIFFNQLNACNVTDFQLERAFSCSGSSRFEFSSYSVPVTIKANMQYFYQ